jgi:hypothetical protein
MCSVNAEGVSNEGETSLVTETHRRNVGANSDKTQRAEHAPQAILLLTLMVNFFPPRLPAIFCLLITHATALPTLRATG